MYFLPEGWHAFKWRIILTLLGLIAGILFLTLGFWKTLLLILTTLAGFLAGKYKDKALDISKLHFDSLPWRRP